MLRNKDSIKNKDFDVPALHRNRDELYPARLGQEDVSASPRKSAPSSQKKSKGPSGNSGIAPGRR